MKELVKADLPFERKVVPLQDAIAYFQSKGQDEKVQLLKFRSKDTLVLYKLRRPLRLPPRLHGPFHRLSPLVRPDARWTAASRCVSPAARRRTSCRRCADSKKLLATFREYNNWLVRLGIENVGAVKHRHPRPSAPAS